MRIIPYDPIYRDDMIFMILEAKDALGRRPTINPDLLDIPGEYAGRGGAFFLALSEEDRVIGSVGYQPIGDAGEVRLHRLYVKADRKRQGIGSALLRTAEESAKEAGYRAASVHLGADPAVWYESRAFYPKHGYRETEDERILRKDL